MGKVLIVDDEEPNLELAEALVSVDGHQAILATDGEMALKMVQEARPDVVMMDIVMPKMNGLEACRRIKTSPLSYALPVIIVTALNSQEEKIKAIQAGADDFIAKPFDRLELGARLKSLIRLKTIHDRLESSLIALREIQGVREELIERTAKEATIPLQTIYTCLQLVAAERHLLSPETAQQIDPAILATETAASMTGDFVTIMQMEQEKLRLAYDVLLAGEGAAGGEAQSAESGPPAAGAQDNT